MYATTDDFELRWFQYRLLQRLLPTNRLLYLYRITDNDECVFCPSIRETNTHAFSFCRQSKNFWAEFRSRLGLRGDLNLVTIITGLYRQREDISTKALSQCILLAKRYLWRSRKAAQCPNTRAFVSVLAGYIRVERYVRGSRGWEFGRISYAVVWCDGENGYMLTMLTGPRPPPPSRLTCRSAAEAITFPVDGPVRNFRALRN